MPTKYSISVIHPSFELLKNASRLLHFMAGTFITLNAVHQLIVHTDDSIICYTQLIIAVDIFILTIFGGSVLSSLPRVGLLFRLIEALTLFGIGATLATETHFILGCLHIGMSIGYFFLLYREWRISISESIEIQQTGIKVPNFFADTEISWLDIKAVVPKYHSIIIETIKNKKVYFKLRHNLKIEELQQIDDFCNRHLLTS
jgi:hypothetical protein